MGVYLNKVSLDALQHQIKHEMALDSGFALYEKSLTFTNTPILEGMVSLPVLQEMSVDNSGGISDFVESLTKTYKGNYAVRAQGSNDIGNIGLASKITAIQIYSHMSQTNWTEDELQKASQNGINLLQDKMAAAVRIYEEEIEHYSLLGADKDGVQIKGVASYVASPSTIAGVGALSGVALETAVVNAIKLQAATVSYIPAYMADLVVVSAKFLMLLSTTSFNSANGSNITVLESLRQKFPSIKFVASAFLDASVAGIDKMMIISTSPESGAIRLPRPWQVSPTSTVGFRSHIEFNYRFGGFDLIKDGAVSVFNITY